ncbi:M20/M25/M40 family metallo-hydrolase [Paraglaciecola sp. 20A4]|uniref:M20/M25/M40 family metallo-hydrolase n=1 Tax=Paraglaciecola sp. 20A4 TaxID=2687288 RepID=UPI001409EEE1|nr:M20/M25/M40 family metallo-hydrolase [Paraglaciecola sp. 20A4]
MKTIHQCQTLGLKNATIVICFFFSGLVFGATTDKQLVDENFKATILLHKEFVSIPNLPANPEMMMKNIYWAQNQYSELGFQTSLLTTDSLPLLLAEKQFNPDYKTILFYFHIDGQPVNEHAWEQENPFIPELKEKDSDGNWTRIDWQKLNETINDEWRIFGRAAADDKAPITMFLTALKILKMKGEEPKFNVKVIFDPEEEYGSSGLKSTLNQYKERYQADYFIVMDGPAHSSNKPTVTFGCRGIVAANITTFGAKLPQHSGHYGNYSPNPVFSLANILASMKDSNGRVLIKDYYQGVELSAETLKLLNAVPFDANEINTALGIHAAEKVGTNYQESLQYPSLNVRQIGTSWTGEGLKTVIPEYATAHLDVRLVPETKASEQLEKIKKHIEEQGYYVIDSDPTDAQRKQYPKIVKFNGSQGTNAFRTDPDSDFGTKVRASIAKGFNEEPVVIRMMGGTVPIVPVINILGIPTVIIPMVNMDNSQHNPNENIRIGNIKQGIHTSLSLLMYEF